MQRRSRRPRPPLWGDPAWHKYWRHHTGAARRCIVATAFGALAAAGHPEPPEAIGDALADAYSALHDEELSLFPEAHETLDRLKDLGVKLALITNGAAEPQRAKVVRFALEHRFDHIQIEGEPRTDGEYPKKPRPTITTYPVTGDQSCSSTLCIDTAFRGCQTTRPGSLIEELAAHSTQERYVYYPSWRGP